MMNIGIGEIIPLTVIIGLLITALILIVRQKPVDTTWLIVVILVPVLGPIVYLMTRLLKQIGK